MRNLPKFFRLNLLSTQIHHFPLDKLIIKGFTGNMGNVMEIIWSNLANYQDILESSFAEFLINRKHAVKTQKNYRSDIRHFFSWITLTIQSQNLDIPQSHQQFLALVTPDLLTKYIHFLVANHIPAATINRRLSAIRLFCEFTKRQGWRRDNPTAILTNVPIGSKPKNDRLKILTHFRSDLARDGASKATIKNYTNDVNQFLKWIASNSEF